MNIDDKIKHAAEELDAHVVEMIKWHFSPDTGSPFWLDWAKEQNWNPLEEITNSKISVKNFLIFKMSG